MASPNPDPNLQDGETSCVEVAKPGRSKWRVTDWLASSNIHEWVKTVTVVVAAGWGIYTFIYKDIWLPSRAPASLIVEVLSLEEGKSRSQAAGVVGKYAQRELNLRITATNPTQRPLFLLPSVWWLWGLERKPAGPETFEKAAIAALQHGGLEHAERGSHIQGTPVLAAGRLFVDNRIQPAEKITRDLPIALPPELSNSDMNQLELVLIVPLLTRNPNQTAAGRNIFGGNRINWSYSDQMDIYPVLCNVLNKCQAVDLGELKTQLNQFDPDALIFQRVILAGKRP